MIDGALNYPDSKRGEEKWSYSIHIFKINQWIAKLWGSEIERKSRISPRFWA